MKEDDFLEEGIPFPEEERKSKTRIKQEMIELQKLGESLVDLPRSFLKKIGLPADLLEAVLYAKEVRTHGARRRQKQWIGTLMRELEDPAFIRLALDQYNQGISGPREEKSAVPELDHTLGLLAEELVSGGEDRIAAMVSRRPSMDPDRLRRLIRHVREASPSSRVKTMKALITYLGKFMNPTNKERSDL
jgi:ribosome-associated protein